MKRMKFLSLIGVSLLLQAATAPAARRDEGVGLYVTMGHLSAPRFEPLYEKALTKNYIDGAALEVEWSAIEPEPNKYDWSRLDRWALEAIRQNKKLSVGVIAGLFSPDWLYDADHGVEFRKFNYNRNPRGTFCSVITLPLPWDKAFQREYEKMMMALADHLRGLKAADAKSAYAWTDIVKLSGINLGTTEIRMNANAPDEGPCHQSDAAAIWGQAGFAPEKILSAWKGLANATDRAFPDKILDMEVIHRNAFPHPELKWSDTVAKAPDELTQRLIDETISSYRAKLIVQWDALWQFGNPREVIEAGNKGARIGWQMNSFRGLDGAGCVYPPFVLSECKTEADFQSILDNGIKAGGVYIEVQAPDPAEIKHDAAFAAAHANLWARAGGR